MIYIAYRTVCNQRNKRKTDILDLVSEYVKLEKEDAITLVCVLFMMKKHLRLQFLKINKYAIALVVKRWKCFQFIQDIKDISFVEAVQELGERVNIKVDIGHSNPSTTQIASEDLK